MEEVVDRLLEVEGGALDEALALELVLEEAMELHVGEAFEEVSEGVAAEGTLLIKACRLHRRETEPMRRTQSAILWMAGKQHLSCDEPAKRAYGQEKDVWRIHREAPDPVQAIVRHHTGRAWVSLKIFKL